MDVAPVILPPGRTFVPIRFISETFRGFVYWNSKTKEVKIVF
ncbi:MAG: stalk domain-containing protein [Caldisericum exile]